jgi:ABC-type multidrug transport system ATPase subunit
MDEPLAHLDSTGRASVGKLLRKMCNEDTLGLSISTILVILQDIAAEEIEECFDQVDEVVKSGGESYVILDANMEDVEVSSPHNVDEYEFRQS